MNLIAFFVLFISILDEFAYLCTQIKNNMAVRIYKNWFGILVNVDSIALSWNGGIHNFLSMRDKEHQSESTWNKIVSYFKQDKNVSFEDFDSYMIDEARKPVGQEGCDGNLYYFAHKDRNMVNSFIELLEYNGLNNQDDFYFVDPLMAYYNNKYPRRWLYKAFATEPVTSKSIRADYIVFVHHPYHLPYTPTRFPAYQGDIKFDTKLIWQICQDALKNDEPEILFNIMAIQERYMNASLWDNKLPSIEEFVKTYITGKISIPHKYTYILDGSKEREDLISKMITFDEESADAEDLPF